MNIPQNLVELDAALRDDRCSKYRMDLDNYNSRPFYDGLYTAQDDSKLLVFISQRVLDVAKRSRTINIQSDATFKVLPGLNDAYQLFVVNLQVRREVFPIAYVIMERKTTAAYVKVFELIQNVLEETSVDLSMSDYETALRNSIRQIFPEAEIKGCYFHYVKAVTKYAKGLGLHRAANEANTIKSGIKYARSLALLPQTLIEEGINIVESMLEPTNECEQFIHYLKRWASTTDISVHGDRVRTNNGTESMHRNLMSLVGKPHPNVYLFIQQLQRFDNKHSLNLKRYNDNVSAPRNRKESYVLSDALIGRAEKYLEMTNDVEGFLRKVANKLKGKFF